MHRFARLLTFPKILLDYYRPRHQIFCVKLHIVILFCLIRPLLAEIDSGGGTAVVGSMTNHSSIGSTFATGNSLVGVDENKSGLIQVLFTGNFVIDPDLNANGLPDKWENQYFPGQTTNPQADSDGDGTSNLMEYLAGTNPTDRSSKFQPAGALNGLTYNMPIQTVQGRTYKVWVTKDLSSWTLHQTYLGDGTQKVFSFDPTTISAGPLHSLTHPSSYFFRVEIVLP